jgi:DeoR/GlpR family transcriptional regulator of sugar metabolism
MLPAQRQQQILEEIRKNGVGSIAELSQLYAVSEMTIRRDLMILEEEGHIKRTHGGALLLNTPTVEPRYAAKQKLHASHKESLARYAAHKLVADGDVIILEGGTTVTAMAPYLANVQNLTVVTNGLYTTHELMPLLPQVTVICTGGILREVSATFVGPVAEQFFREFHANKLFLSATGLTLDAGFTDPSMLETQIKKAMIVSAEQVIMLLDSNKFGVKSFTTVLQAGEPDLLVTDPGAPEDVLALLRVKGVEVHLVPAES